MEPPTTTCRASHGIDRSTTHRVRGVAASVTLAFLALLLAGCPTIPKNGALLAGKLTEGIQRNQTETEKIIKALADTQRAILDEKWDGLYAQVETAFLKSEGVSDAKDLTPDQRSSLAATMSEVWERLSAAIAAKENELLVSSRANAAQLVAINETIQKYLLSLEDLDASRAAITAKISDITGVDLGSLSGLADKLLKEFQP